MESDLDFWKDMVNYHWEMDNQKVSNKIIFLSNKKIKIKWSSSWFFISIGNGIITILEESGDIELIN
ncbi:hypothetical protein BpHYR1_005685 [Brachionus plicatilis]|uniref:Uncharacterized protein n=1 Tax=Brachionus plicatilis TaxID=10195 RepID=A0A3M7QTF6_BRAPC|nr:hypothetical protein BpHYR1_005685 [Brachionus plicatilis]